MAMQTEANTDDILRGLECTVCQEQFRDPRMLPCGHTLCLDPCMEQIAKANPKLCCPECRAEHDIPKEGVQRFPKNVAILRQLPGTIASQEEFCAQRCPICGDDDDLQKCVHCRIYICYTCATEHITSMKDHIRELTSEITEQADNAEKKYSSIEEKAMEVINRTTNDAVAQIEKATQQVFALVEKKANELKIQIANSRQEEIAKVSAMSKNSKQSWADIKELCMETASKCAAENVMISPSKLMTVSEKLTAERNRATEMDKGCCVYETAIGVKMNLQCINGALQELATVIVTEKDQIHTDIAASCDDPEPETSHCTSECDSEPDDHIENIIHKDVFNIKLEFGEEGSLPGQLSNLKILALDNSTDDIVVLDANNHRVQRFDSDGTLNLSFGYRGSGPDQLDSPVAIAINPQSQMVISDRGNHRIKVHNGDGSLCRIIGHRGSKAGELDDPRGLALDKQGNIHICDYTKHSVQVLSQEGMFLKQYVPPGCTEPLHISIFGNGTTCVADLHNCFVLDGIGQLEHTWRVDGFVSALCTVGDNHILVSDEKRNTLTIYTTEGEQMRVFFLDEVPRSLSRRGLAVDIHGDIYVACRSTILKF